MERRGDRGDPRWGRRGVRQCPPRGSCSWLRELGAGAARVHRPRLVAVLYARGGRRGPRRGREVGRPVAHPISWLSPFGRAGRRRQPRHCDARGPGGGPPPRRPDPQFRRQGALPPARGTPVPATAARRSVRGWCRPPLLGVLGRQALTAPHPAPSRSRAASACFATMWSPLRAAIPAVSVQATRASSSSPSASKARPRPAPAAE